MFLSGLEINVFGPGHVGCLVGSVIHSAGPQVTVVGEYSFGLSSFSTDRFSCCSIKQVLLSKTFNVL